MRKRILAAMMALSLVVSVFAAPLAYAADLATVSTTRADVSTDGIVISADAENLSALLDDCPFGIGNFKRAATGTNRSIGGEYRGYNFVVGSEKSSTVMYLVTDSFVLVYIDPDAAASAGFDAESEDDLAMLQRYLVTLDSEASNNVPIPASCPWYFTTEKVNDIDGVSYRFLQEYAQNGESNLYNCVIGVDGGDVTDSEHKPYVKPQFCCFGDILPADQVVIADPPSWTEELAEFMGKLDWSPLWVTLRTSLTAIVFIFVLGLGAAYLCLHVSPRARDFLDTIFTIPMVLPPTVCGFLLMYALGKNSPLGQWFIDIGFPLVFSWPATVVAAVVVAFPLMYRSAFGAFENLDPNMLDAARTLGWKESRIFFKLMLPLSWSSITAGTVLAYARALGEFGATLFLAGNVLGVTRTIPIAIYFYWMNGGSDLNIALFWTIVLVIISFVVIVFINLWSRHTTRYRKGAVEK